MKPNHNQKDDLVRDEFNYQTRVNNQLFRAIKLMVEVLKKHEVVANKFKLVLDDHTCIGNNKIQKLGDDFSCVKNRLKTVESEGECEVGLLPPNPDKNENVDIMVALNEHKEKNKDSKNTTKP
ncbi:hypothetical protein QTN25_000893 [Entamoeba marina]